MKKLSSMTIAIIGIGGALFFIFCFALNHPLVKYAPIGFMLAVACMSQILLSKQGYWWTWIISLFLGVFTYAVIAIFVVQPYRITLRGMEPTLLHGDHAIVIKFYNRIHRGDILIYHLPGEKKHRVHRVIGLPGEELEIRDGNVIINRRPVTPSEKMPEIEHGNRGEYGKPGQIIKIPEDHFYLLGDNSSISYDSRDWGFLNKTEIIGKVACFIRPIFRLQEGGSYPLDKNRNISESAGFS